MKFLALDTETTGLDVTKDCIIELGYALYEIDNDAPIVVKSDFMVPKEDITKEVTDITGITADIIDRYAKQPDEVLLEFINFITDNNVDFYVAHNGLEYDIPILKNNCARHGLELPKLPVIDTKIDLPLKYKPKSTSLVYMAADHGFINPFPHRALTDAMTCMRLLNLYDKKNVLAISSTPMLEIRADVRYEQRDLAKKRGYNWDGDRKIWVKKIRKFFLDEERKAPFPVLTLSVL